MQCHWGQAPPRLRGLQTHGHSPRKGQGGQEETQAEGATPGSSLTQPLPRHFQLTLSKAPQGEKVRSQHSSTAPDLPGFTMGSGALGMAPPPLPPGLPSGERAHRQESSRQGRGQPGCLDLQWVGSYCLDSVLSDIQFQVGLEFSRRGLLSMGHRHPGPHPTQWLGTIWADTVSGPLRAGRQAQQALAVVGVRISGGCQGCPQTTHAFWSCPLSLSLIPKLNIKQDQAFSIGPAPEL